MIYLEDNQPKFQNRACYIRLSDVLLYIYIRFAHYFRYMVDHLSGYMYITIRFRSEYLAKFTITLYFIEKLKHYTDLLAFFLQFYVLMFD